MKKFFFSKNIFFCLILFITFIYETKEIYKEIPLKLEKKGGNVNLPLYIETSDACSKWVPALFSQILIIKKDISTENYEDKNWKLDFKSNPSSKEVEGNLEMYLYSGSVSNFHPIFLALSQYQWPSFCQFGLGYSDIIAVRTTDNFNYNSMKNLISSKQLEKNVFSFDKWNFNDSELITSKIYIGDSHEDFLEDNVGTCKINDTNYFGCIFDDFIFLNETFPLTKQNNQSYIIYFSSEFTKIYFPQDFMDKITDNGKCEYSTATSYNIKLTCEELKGKEYLPLKLRSANMNITLEVDYIGRYYQYSIEGVANLLFHNYDYIIFP